MGTFDLGARGCRAGEAEWIIQSTGAEEEECWCVSSDMRAENKNCGQTMFQ